MFETAVTGSGHYGLAATRDECERLGHAWTNAAFHFDNTAQAMLTMFVLTTLEDWETTLYNMVDATAIGTSATITFF